MNFICAAENQFASYIANFFPKEGSEKCLWYSIICVKRSRHIHTNVHMLRIDMNNQKELRRGDKLFSTLNFDIF